MKKDDGRLQALKILTSLLQDRLSLAQQMPVRADVSPLTKELCYGVCRHYFRLQALVDCLLVKKPKALEIWVALLMGLYQLHYMQKPDYAVVKETVDLLEKVRMGWAKGLVNAVLRNFCRQKSTILDKVSASSAFIHGHPEWLMQRLQKDWPQDWQGIVAANDLHPPMTIRVNQRKIAVAAYMQALEVSGIQACCHQIANEGITLNSPCEVVKLPGFEKGWVSVQDAAAQLAASLLCLASGHRVLDACCAPGGKTCHILECHPDLQECVALDVDSRRLDRVKENLQRLGLSATLITGSALTPEQWWDGRVFDRILLDAPCSATGVIRRHSDIKLVRTPEDVAQVTQTQRAMLEALWPLLAPGGLMVYVTCSVLSEENGEQIERFLQNHEDAVMQKNEESWGCSTAYGQQILPGSQGMDGFFYSVLIKKG